MKIGEKQKRCQNHPSTTDILEIIISINKISRQFNLLTLMQFEIITDILKGVNIDSSSSYLKKVIDNYNTTRKEKLNKIKRS